MRLASLAALVLVCAAPARAQWTRVPLAPQITEPAQVALFGFAEAFGSSLYVSAGFGVPQTPASPVYEYVFVTRDGGATWAAVPEFTADITNSGGLRLGRPTVADGALYVPRLRFAGGQAATSTVLKTTTGTAWTVPAAAGFPVADGPLANVARQGGVLYGHTTSDSGTSDVGYVFRSADEGASWTRVGAQRVPGLTFAAGSRLLLGRGQGNTANGERSADGGAAWTPHGSPIFTAARNTAGVVLTGALFNVQRSTDGGTTFAPVPATTFGFGGTFAVGACEAAFVAVASGVVKRSDDGGTTWAAWAEGLPGNGANVRQLSCSAGGPSAGGPTYVYAAVSGSSGSPDAGVYRRDLAQMPTAAADAPGALRLALSAGPNPASGTATLRFTLDAAQPVRVTVTDALGRAVLALDRTLGAGPQALPLDVSGLAPGVYVARVTTSGASASVRLTLAR